MKCFAISLTKYVQHPYIIIHLYKHIEYTTLKKVNLGEN